MIAVSSEEKKRHREIGSDQSKELLHTLQTPIFISSKIQREYVFLLDGKKWLPTKTLIPLDPRRYKYI